jgi:hypothetical protein
MEPQERLRLAGSIPDATAALQLTAPGGNDGILTKNSSFRMHVGGVGVGLKSHNLDTFFLLINGLSAGGRPLWHAGCLGACQRPCPTPARFFWRRCRSRLLKGRLRLARERVRGLWPTAGPFGACQTRLRRPCGRVIPLPGRPPKSTWSNILRGCGGAKPPARRTPPCRFKPAIRAFVPAATASRMMFDR